MKYKNTEYRTQNVVLKQKLLSSKFYKLLTSKTWGFTLIELIVTIVILAILWTIAFISFQWYSRSSRDSVRIADINSVEKSLWIYVAKTWFYPAPDSNKEITYAWGTAWIEWTIWDTVMKNIDNVSKKPIDPLTSNEYTYSITSSKKEYEIWAISEWQNLTYNNSFVPNSYAADLSKTNAVAYMKWNYNEKIIKIATWWINYILAIPTIIVTDITNPRIEDLIAEKKLVYRNFTNIPHSYNPTWTGGFNYETNRIEVYSWAAVSLEYNIDKISFIENLQDAYNWTILWWTENYEDITNIDTSTEADKAVDLVNNYITNNVWWITWKITTLIYNTCTLDWQIIDHNQTITAYSENSILSWASYECVDRSQERTCNNWVLSWDDSYQYKSCIKWTANNCEASWSYVYNTHIYSVPSVNNWETATNIVSSNVNENNWTFTYTLTSIWCNDWVFINETESSPTVISCDTWYTISWNSCIPITYTVNFDWNWWTWHTPTTKSVDYNTAIWTLPSNPTMSWYTFNGWYTTSTWWSQVTESTIVLWNTTVYANWSVAVWSMELVYTWLVNWDIIELPFKWTVNITNIDWWDDWVNNCPTTTTGIVSCTYTNASKWSYTIHVSWLSTWFWKTTTASWITKLTQVPEWQWMWLTDLSNAFRGASNLVYLDPSLDTSNVTDMSWMFLFATSFNQSLSNFDTSNVTNMKWMFYWASIFNQPLSNFNTSKVTNMSQMFRDATVFNKSLSSFDTSNVTDMAWMFAAAIAFNQSLSNFDTSNVLYMYRMFAWTDNFNQSLSNFNTSKVTTMMWMFDWAISFNQPLTNFNTSNVTSMAWMFMRTSSFNQPLTNFNTSKVTTMSQMFNWATLFNQPLSNFDTSKVTNMSWMFTTANAFNQSLSNFDTSNVINMSYMFMWASSFNQPLTNFNTSKVTNMSSMFWSAISFNQPLTNFDTSNVTDMSNMFNSATSFNQSLSNFNTSKVTSSNMVAMFWYATNFNKNISCWNVWLISSEPTSFATSSALISSNKPLWWTNGSTWTCE